MSILLFISGLISDAFLQLFRQ